jgi:hypothetical protein
MACVLVTPAAALADSNPNPAGALNGFTPGGSTTTVPLPDEIAHCLSQSGYPVPSAGTQVGLPATTGALPAGLAGTIPLPAITAPTTTGTIPLSGTATPTTATTTTTSTIPVPGIAAPAATGTNPLPAQGGATSTGGLQCGQMIINNTVYLVTVTLTTTTTTTTADGPIAAGPVTVTGNGPAAAPVTTRKQPTHRRARRKRAKVRKHSAHRRAAHRAQRGQRALHIVLVKKTRGNGSH